MGSHAHAKVPVVLVHHHVWPYREAELYFFLLVKLRSFAGMLGISDKERKKDTDYVCILGISKCFLKLYVGMDVYIG